MVDKNIHRRPITNTVHPDKLVISEPAPTPSISPRMSQDDLRREIARRKQLGHSFRKIASELRISYVEVARIAGGLE